VNGLHLDADEKCVSEILMLSPIFAFLRGMKGIKSHVRMKPLHVNVETASDPVIELQSAAGKCWMGVRSGFALKDGGLSAEITSTGYLRYRPTAPISLVDAIALVGRIEKLFSLLCCDYVRAKSVHIEVSAADREGTKSSKFYEIERARVPKKTKQEFEEHRLPFRIDRIDFGYVFDQFIGIFDDIEQALSWYRIVVAEDRYLEDRYFYCVRILESTYRSLAIETQPDRESATLLNEIRSRFTEPVDARLLEFINSRVVSIFSRPWALGDIVRDLRARYSSMRIVDLLDERLINKLRGKEAHGASQGFSSQELAFMVHSTRILRLLFVLTVLERCGISRDFLLEWLGRSSQYSDYFSLPYVQRVQAEISSRVGSD
jgi:hypothetical protein